MNNLKTVVYQRLEAIANAEKITRKELSAMSRELLLYVPESNDIDIVNRLLGILTPMNKRVAILYFGKFLPWEKETDNNDNFQRFGKRIKGERNNAKRLKLITEWLADERNDIWLWSDKNIELKPKDFKSIVAKAIAKALEGDEKTDTPPLSRAEVMLAVMDGGVTFSDIETTFVTLEAMAKEAEDQGAEPDEQEDAA